MNVVARAFARTYAPQHTRKEQLAAVSCIRGIVEHAPAGYLTPPIIERLYQRLLQVLNACASSWVHHHQDLAAAPAAAAASASDADATPSSSLEAFAIPRSVSPVSGSKALGGARGLESDEPAAASDLILATLCSLNKVADRSGRLLLAQLPRLISVSISSLASPDWRTRHAAAVLLGQLPQCSQPVKVELRHGKGHYTSEIVHFLNACRFDPVRATSSEWRQQGRVF